MDILYQSKFINRNMPYSLIFERLKCVSYLLYQIIKYKGYTVVDHIVQHSLLLSKFSILKYNWESHSP